MVKLSYNKKTKCKLYRCDPDKNKCTFKNYGCCYRNGGGCKTTLWKKFRMTNMFKRMKEWFKYGIS